MATDSNNPKWLHFSGKTEKFAACCTGFIAFMQSKGLQKTLIGNEDKIRPLDNLPEDLSKKKRAARDAQQKEYTIECEEKENGNITVRCYLALMLDSTILSTIRLDCLNADGIGDSEADWKYVFDHFPSNEAPTVVSIVSQLAKLKMSEVEGIQSFFIRAQEL